VIAPDSRAEKAIDDALLALWTWVRDRPAVEARARTLRSATAAKVVAWWVKRRDLAYRLRACGGKSPRWHESNAERAARVDWLARTGRDE
jgi:hypothetical protein